MELSGWQRVIIARSRFHVGSAVAARHVATSANPTNPVIMVLRRRQISSITSPALPPGEFLVRLPIARSAALVVRLLESLSRIHTISEISGNKHRMNGIDDHVYRSVCKLILSSS